MLATPLIAPRPQKLAQSMLAPSLIATSTQKQAKLLKSPPVKASNTHKLAKLLGAPPSKAADLRKQAKLLKAPHVSDMHYRSTGLIVRYSFKQLGFNGTCDMTRLETNLSRKGKYVFFGASRRNNDTHKRLLTSTSTKSLDTDKIDTWIKGKPMLNDHAIGVDLDEHLQGTIYDNGCIGGENFFSIQNLATRMRWMNQCYLMDLYVINK